MNRSYKLPRSMGRRIREVMGEGQAPPGRAGGRGGKQGLLALMFRVWAGSAALQALRRKKRLEQQLAQTDGTLSTLEFQREAIENATTNAEVLRTMDLAAKGMKKAYQDMWVRGEGRRGPRHWGE